MDCEEQDLISELVEKFPFCMKSTAFSILIANIARNVGQVLILLSFAWALGAEDAGKFTFALAVNAPVFIILGLGMRTIVLTLDRSVTLREYEIVRFSSVLVAIAISFVFSLFVTNGLASVIVLVAFMKGSDSFEDLYSAKLQKHNMLTRLTLQSVLLAVVRVAGVVSTLAFGQGLICALAVASISSAFLIWLSGRTFVSAIRKKEDAQRASYDNMKMVVKKGLPAGISIGAITLLSSIPQYLLAAIVGFESVAIFSLLLYIIILIEMILNALSQAWIPHARFKALHKELTFRYIIKVTFKWSFICVPLAIVASVFCIILIPLVLQAPQLSMTILIPIILIAAVIPLVFSTATALSVLNFYGKLLNSSLIVLLLAAIIASQLYRYEHFSIVVAFWFIFVTTLIRALLNVAIVCSSSVKSSNAL